uniref:NADH-ubiquinone oxidoreductase chain 4L n=1 Tax=Phallocryptus tserensodnomi TaxID=1383053 RepID=A0A0U1ZAF1_9CRUS|nr:NADH dehydrogenase subunit 4L [Phallocryptus tserensodnomi]AJP76848.1 NADH dehydrogenase subunit 4L [Phallocryptus tserensodnomi]
MMMIMILVFSLSLIIFLSSSKHLLVSLLCLEFLILLLFFFLCYSPENSFLSCFYFLTIGVCEGALGLSTLVSLVRSEGSDLAVLMNV